MKGGGAAHVHGATCVTLADPLGPSPKASFKLERSEICTFGRVNPESTFKT